MLRKMVFFAWANKVFTFIYLFFTEIISKVILRPFEDDFKNLDETAIKC